MPANTVYVGRPNKLGNPFEVGLHGDQEECISLYREWVSKATPGWLQMVKSELRGKDLACWCPLVDKDGKPVPCHADVLLEIANQEGAEPCLI